MPASTMKEWITDRQPTKADGDKNEDVRVRRRPGASESEFRLIHWSYVGIGVPWRHTSHWQPAESDRLAALEQRVAELEERFAGLRTATATALELLRPES